MSLARPTPSTAPTARPKFRSSSIHRSSRCRLSARSGRPAANFLFGPGIQYFDAAVFKRFAFTNPLLGRLTSVRDPRIMQMALKLYF
jgi:hypothetical protein